MEIITKQEAVSYIKDGMTLMVGGFLSNGTPEELMDAIVEKKVKNLTIIANDGGTASTGVAKLIAAGLVKKLIATHIGMNPMVGQLMNEKKLEVELVPQGSMAEKIRAGGAGLGGVLTKTGLGTDVEKGKQIVVIDDQEYLLEKPLHADMALIRGSVVDQLGNIIYKGTTQNFNPLMATAADIVIVQAQTIVPTMKGEEIHTPSIFVDYVISPLGGESNV